MFWRSKCWRAREHENVQMASVGGAVGLSFRCVGAALLGTALSLMGASVVPAQQRMQGTTGDQRHTNVNARAGQAAPGDRDAADRLEGLGGAPEALLGAPRTPGDAYGAAYNLGEHDADALTNTERVPRGALEGERYGPQPAKPGRAPLPGAAANKDAGDAPKPYENKADPGAQTPMGSALSIYHGPGDVGKAAGQVYKMPW